MPRTNELSIDLRIRIVEDRKSGLSFGQLAQKYKISKSGARKMVMKFEKENTLANLPGRGRKKKTTPHEDRRIVREVKKKGRTSTKEIKESLNLSVSEKTIGRRLKAAGYISSYERKKPHISPKNKKKRLAFAKEHLSKPIQFWSNVLWTDESKFELFGSKKRERVWRKSGEALLERNVKMTRKFGGGNIMVWGCFSRNGVGELARIESIMTGESYVHILKENLPKSVEKLRLERNYVFQQDNDPKHTSRVATAFFTKNNINVLKWPAQSPDLNPIENLWGILDTKLPKNRSSADNCFELLKKAWEEIDQNVIANLIESIPNRLKCVIKNRGGPTNY